MESQTHRNREQNGGYQGLRDRKNGEILAKAYKLPLISPRDPMYNMVTMVNKTGLYILKLLRE